MSHPLLPRDVLLFESLARIQFVDTPANMEFTDGSSISGHHAKVCTLVAALSVFQAMGLIEKDVSFDLHEPFKEDFS
jgi:hypothetical protein